MGKQGKEEEIESGPKEDDVGHHAPGVRTGASAKTSVSVQSGHANVAGHTVHVGHFNANMKGGKGARQREEQIIPTLSDARFTQEPVGNNFNRR